MGRRPPVGHGGSGRHRRAGQPGSRPTSSSRLQGDGSPRQPRRRGRFRVRAAVRHRYMPRTPSQALGGEAHVRTATYTRSPRIRSCGHNASAFPAAIRLDRSGRGGAARDGLRPPRRARHDEALATPARTGRPSPLHCTGMSSSARAMPRRRPDDVSVAVPRDGGEHGPPSTGVTDACLRRGADQAVSVKEPWAAIRISSESGEPLVARDSTSAPNRVQRRTMPSWSSPLRKSAKSATPSV